MVETLSEPMLIEQALPQFDAVRREHLVVPGSVERVYEATRQADFLEAWRGSPVVRFLFGARSLAERTVASVRGVRFEEPPPPDRLCLADMPQQGDWVLLGEDPPHEIAFGVIGRFWAGETAWEQIDASEFESFARPGLAKIACNFSLRTFGSSQTLISYECRTRGTDPESTRRFLKYWHALSPFIGVVLRAQLSVINQEVIRK